MLSLCSPRDCWGMPHNTEQGEIPKNVFMVFEYLEYDLTGILESPEIRFTQDHIKSWSQQLLSGVHYMHTNKGKQEMARTMNAVGVLSVH